MIIRGLEDIIMIQYDKEVNVDINELLEVEIRYIDSDEKEVTLWMCMNKDKLNEAVKLDRGEYREN